MRLLDPHEVTDRLKVSYHESAEMIRAAEDLDQILLALVFAARHILDPIHLYSVRDDELTCQLALDQQAFTEVHQWSLSLKSSPLVSRVTSNGILYLGPIPDTEPSIKFLPASEEHPNGIGVLPIVIKGRTLFVLMGYLLMEPSRQVLEDLAMLGTDTAMAIAALIISKRRAQSAATDGVTEERDRPRVHTSLQWPAGSQGTRQRSAPETRADFSNQKAGKSQRRPAKFNAAKQRLEACTDEQVIPLKKIKRVPTKPMWPEGRDGSSRADPRRSAQADARPGSARPQAGDQEQVFELVNRKRPTANVLQLADNPVVSIQPEYLSAESAELDEVVELLYPKEPTGPLPASCREPRQHPRDPAPATAGQAPPPASPGTSSARTASPSDRMHVRFPLEVEVSYSSDHNFFTGFMENISDGGIFVATYASFEIGERLELVFTLPGVEGWCTTVCEVRWIREFNPDIPDAIPGMGLRFLKLEERLVSAITRFARTREPIFYDD